MLSKNPKHHSGTHSESHLNTKHSHLNTLLLQAPNLYSTRDDPLIGGHSFRHPNLHSTGDASLIGGQKTLSHLLSLRTKSVNLTLLSKSVLVCLLSTSHQRKLRFFP